MKKFLIGLLVFMLISFMFPAVAYASSEVELYDTGDSTAEWTTEEAKFGDYSVKLTMPAGTGWVNDNAEVRIVIPGAPKISEITGWSYWIIAPDSYTVPIEFYIDTNNDGEYDKIIIGQKSGGTPEGWFEVDKDYLDMYMTWKNGYKWLWNWNKVQENYGDATLLRVDIGYGSLGSNEDVTAYVDDFTLNGDTYALEAPPDTTSPVITLLGETPVNLYVGDSYTDAGATALDDVDGDITGSIVVVNPVDTSTAGTYTITYNVSDAAGNKATEVTRTVIVSKAPEPEPPPSPPTAPNYVQQTVGAGTNTVDASSVAGAYATITGSGGQTVTIEGISSAAASAGGFYIEGATTYVDLHLDTSEGIEQIQFTILGGAGVPRWWNGSSWIECSDYTIDAAGNVTTTITNSTTPSLSDLTGTVFTVFGEPAIAVLGITETTPVEIITVRTNPLTCWQVWINEDNMFEFVFWWEYKNNNWVKIYDMAGNEVFSIDMSYGAANFEASLPDGMYKVKTYHDNWDKPLQEFIIGKP